MYYKYYNISNAVLYIYAEVQISSCDPPNELHCLRVHGVRRLCLQWSFLHCFPTFHEGQSSINVIHRLPELVHLGNKSRLTNSTPTQKQNIERNALIWLSVSKQEVSVSRKNLFKGCVETDSKNITLVNKWLGCIYVGFSGFSFASNQS